MIESTEAAAERSRSERLVKQRSQLKKRFIVGGIVVSLLLVAAALLAGRWYGLMQVAPPDYVVVIGESVLEDGTKAAGLVAVVERDADGYSVTAVDPEAPRAVPGTSFDRLSDALAMGGPQLVARLVAADIDGAEEPAWLLLEQPGWAGVLSAGGPASVKLEEPITAFTGNSLYRFTVGSNRLTGDEAAALLLATASFEDTEAGAAMRLRIAELVGDAVADEPDAVASALDAGLGEYSGRSRQLENFLGR